MSLAYRSFLYLPVSRFIILFKYYLICYSECA